MTRVARLSVVISYVAMVLLFDQFGVGQARVSQAAEIKEYMEQGQHALRDNRPEDAAQAYRAVLKIDPVNVEARANLGIVAMARGNWTEAAEELQKALKLRPSQRRVQALLGLCEVHLGDLEDAAKLLSSSFLHLDDAKLRREVGLQLLELWSQGGELEKAEAVLGQLQQSYLTMPWCCTPPIACTLTWLSKPSNRWLSTLRTRSSSTGRWRSIW